MQSSSKSYKDNLKRKPETWHRHYTDQERRILVQLVLDRFDIIEQNLKDPFTQECKQEAWAEVVQRFNADVRCNHQRDTKQIKKLWDNIKTRAKRMVQDQRLQKTMRGENSGATGSTPSLQVVGDDATDLDALAGDSVAEKVIYYMKMIAQPHSSVTFEVDDEEEEEEELDRPMHLYTESDYDSMMRSEEDVILCDDNEPEPHPPAPKHFALEPQSFRDPPHPLPGPVPAESSEYMGTLSKSYMEQGRDSHSNASKSVRFRTTNQQDVAQPSSSAQQRPPSAQNGTTSRVTMATSSSTTPSYDDGWVAENSGNSRTTGSGPAAATNSSRGDRNTRTIKRLRKEEYELKIRKLRLEMKYARIEHEERLKVIRAQREVLNSLKPDPSSIIGSLFK